MSEFKCIKHRVVNRVKCTEGALPAPAPQTRSPRASARVCLPGLVSAGLVSSSFPPVGCAVLPSLSCPPHAECQLIHGGGAGETQGPVQRRLGTPKRCTRHRVRRMANPASGGSPGVCEGGLYHGSTSEQVSVGRKARGRAMLQNVIKIRRRPSCLPSDKLAHVGIPAISLAKPTTTMTSLFTVSRSFPPVAYSKQDRNTGLPRKQKGRVQP